MKTIFTLFVIITAPLFLFAQQKWVSFKVDNRVTADFPFAPQRIDDNTYMSFESDSSQVYALYIIDLKEIGADSTMIEKAKKQPDFASGLGQVALKSIKGLKMAEVKIDNRGGFSSYTTSGTDGKGKVYQLLMLIVGTKFYSFMECHAAHARDKTADRFFSSLKIK